MTATAIQERLMVTRGTNRYLQGQDKMINRGLASGADAYKHLIKDSILSFSNRVEDLKASTRGKGRNKLVGYLRQIPSLSIAYITLSTVWNRIATEDTRRTPLCALIGNLLEDEFNFLTLSVNSERLWKRLQRYALERDAYHYQRLFIFNAARKSEGWEPTKWTPADKILIGFLLLREMEQEGLIECSKEWTGKGMKQVADVLPTQKVLDYLQECRTSGEKGDLPMISPIFAPITEVPRPWTTPYDGGYHHIRMPLVKAGKASYATADMAKVYSSVNAMQSVCWSIDETMLQLVEHCWQKGIVIGSLPKGTQHALPEKMTDAQWQALTDQQRGLLKLERRELHTANRVAMSDLASVSQTLSQARDLVGAPVYLPYQLDYRGRVYAMPLLNQQGPDYIRCLFNFAEGKPITASGAVWLAIQVATLYDAALPSGRKASKASFEERYRWTQDNEQLLRAVSEDPLGIDEWHGADKPWMFLRSAMEWCRYLDEGEDFVSNIPIALDGSCSGIQHYSALLRDPVGGASVNLVPCDLPADVYGDVAAVVSLAVASDHVASPERDFWLDHGITRKTVKKPVMTYGYSSRLPGFTEWYEHEFVRPAIKASKEVKESGPAALYLARKTLAAVEQQLLSVASGMEWMIQCARLLANEGKGVSWVAPNGFPVVQRYENFELIQVETVLQGMRLKVRVPGDDTRTINKTKQASAISPNHTHSLDAAHLMLTVLHARDTYGITNFALIHDSFGTLAADTDSLFMAVREAFVEMYQSSDPFEDLYQRTYEALSEEGRKLLPRPPEKGSLDLEQIKSSLYAFA